MTVKKGNTSGVDWKTVIEGQAPDPCEQDALETMELATLRIRLFLRAGVWSRAQGRSTLGLAVPPAWRA